MINSKYFFQGLRSLKSFDSPAIALGASFIAISVDHEISKNFSKNQDFEKFKDQCSKIGTTEEALANAEKLGFNTKLFAEHPFLKDKKIINELIKKVLNRF